MAQAYDAIIATIVVAGDATQVLLSDTQLGLCSYFTY